MTPASSNPERKVRPSPGLRILIVDDESGIRSLLKLVFSNVGYEVLTAADAHEAMELCASNDFHVVLTDVQMPGMSGHDLARWLALNRPAVRWVLMTGFNEDCPGCPLANRCQYLHKPFSPQEAVSMVEAVLKRECRGASASRSDLPC